MTTSKKKPAALVMGAALVGGMALPGTAFSMQPLAQGYLLSATTESKVKEGACGAQKAAEGCCGTAQKIAEGKCGEGQCGGTKCGDADPAAADKESSQHHVAALAQRTAKANAALVSGDIEGYLTLTRHAKDYTLMSPLGGEPTRGFDTSSEHRAALARFFNSGTFDQELVASYDSGDLVVLVTLERSRAQTGGMPEQAWSLRVTQVFRRDGADWQLVHRHADPLVNGIGVEQAAALARGDKK